MCPQALEEASSGGCYCYMPKKSLLEDAMDFCGMTGVRSYYLKPWSVKAVACWRTQTLVSSLSIVPAVPMLFLLFLEIFPTVRQPKIRQGIACQAPRCTEEGCALECFASAIVLQLHGGIQQQWLEIASSSCLLVVLDPFVVAWSMQRFVYFAELCGIMWIFIFCGFVADFCLSCAHGAPRHVSCCFVQRC